MTLIAFFTSLLIILFIIAILYRHTKPSETHIQIIHLLLIYLVVTSILDQTTSVTIYFPSVKLSSTNCRNFDVVYHIFAGSGHWAAFMLSLNRMIAVVFPHHYARFNKRSATVATILIGWLILLACSLPFFVGSGWYVTNVPPWNNCAVLPMTHGNGKIFQARAILSIHVPISGTIVLYVLILLSQLRKKFNRDGAVDRKMQATLERRILIGKMLCASQLWDLACYLPQFVLANYLNVFAKNPHLILLMWALESCGDFGTPNIGLG
ncbi:prostaglandin E2 receptor EP3 subtype-like [Paramacrobiotus metropolitanus]|uniref:prostaglandin E2 receptor EP3 subtype-like n=1 Tax=Paramacrobiotus metropolitanus TaxID=2943436 RepID=UPI00244585DA|nr:prostaglandin E2 receptor EP3 subtype-like [Paramacrobiotus metropolitanus]